jgi:glycosyltransferase involved in cell wall biosynthesis
MKSTTTVVVDARVLHVSGLGRYLREILAGLVADERFSRLTILGDPVALRDFLGTAGDSRLRIVPFPLEIYSPRFQVAWAKLAGWLGVDADVVFFPHYDVPLLAFPKRSVVTVHDLIHFQLPEEFGGWRRIAAGLLLRTAVRGATSVVTVSKSTRDDLVERFPDTADKIRVVHNGVSREFSARKARVPIVPQTPYLLCVGNRKSHKNLVTAVRVLAELREEYPDLQLVIVGRSFPEWSRVLETAVELGVRPRIIEFESVSDAELLALYNHCQGLLFPSLYEGFGFPVLEAMAAGAPVIATNRSSVPELVGDSGFLYDPTDVRAMAEAARRVMRDSGLREMLARRGRERAASFPWSRAIGQTTELLYSVGSSGRRSGLTSRRRLGVENG